MRIPGKIKSWVPLAIKEWAHRWLKHHRRIRYRRVFPNQEPLSWGIVGTGYMAKVFAEALNNSNDNIAYAVLSRSMTKALEFGERFAIYKCYSNLNEFLLDSNIDVVYIATPLETHFYYCNKALEAGKNVLCEKPLVNSTQMAKQLIKTAREKNCLLVEGMWSHVLPTYLQAMEWINNGEIGDIKEIIIEKARLKNYLREDKKIQSVLWDYGIYPISFANFFLKNLKISHVTSLLDADGLDTGWHITLEENDKHAFIEISGRYKGSSKAFIIGNKGTIEFEGHFNRTDTIRLYDLSARMTKEKKFSYTNQGFEYEINELNRLIRNGSKESEILNNTDMLKTLLFMEQIAEQAK